MEARAVPQVSNSQIAVKKKLKNTSVSSVTKALIIHFISIDTNWCTLAFERTNAPFAQNHLHYFFNSKHTNLFTLAFERTNAQHVSSHSKQMAISKRTK